MPIDPSIPLQARGFQLESPMTQAGNVLGILNAIGQQRLREQQMRLQMEKNPLEMLKLQAEIDAIPELAAQRRAATAKTNAEAAAAEQSRQATNMLARLYTPQGYGQQPPDAPTLPNAVFSNEADAIAAARAADARGEQVVTGVPNPGTAQALQIMAAPNQAIPAMIRAQNQQHRPTVVGPGAGLYQGGQLLAERPFAPRAEPAPVVRVVPGEGGKFNYEDMRNPGTPLAPAPTPPSTRDPRAQAAYQAGLRDIQKDEKDLSNVAQLETALNRWRELNANTPTGRVAGLRPGVAQPQFQELVQLQNYLAVNNFKPGQGQISNYERQLIRGAGPSVNNDHATNERIVQVQLGAVQNARERAAFREWFLESNGKLIGADKQWMDYIEKNPRYLSGEKGAIVENPDRVDWMTWFTAPRIKNDAEYEQLPSNELFFGPDGKPRRKP